MSPWNMDLSTSQTNSGGQIALCYKNTTSPLVELGSVKLGTYRGYKFVTQHNICLAWVNPEDAQKILDIREGCNCGGKKQPAYRVASETEVRRWTYGGR